MEENVKKKIDQNMMNDTIDLLELAQVLLKKAWLIVICAIVGAVVAGGYTKFMVTPQYEASSMIYVLGKTTSIADGINL